MVLKFDVWWQRRSNPVQHFKNDRAELLTFVIHTGLTTLRQFAWRFPFAFHVAWVTFALSSCGNQFNSNATLQNTGLTVASESRCSPYTRSDYPYPRSVEAKIVAQMGGVIYGPYTGRHYASTRETDIEHIVAISEAHDSGLCAADQATRQRFSADTLNLTLAAPSVNRCGGNGKCALDAAEWLPPMNRCWFAARVVAVKRKYGLTANHQEATALARVLSECTSVDMVVTVPGTVDFPSRPRANLPTSSANADDALRRWDDNGNGQITCSEARRHGIAPVPRSHPAYRHMHDGDGDGVVCE